MENIRLPESENLLLHHKVFSVHEFSDDTLVYEALQSHQGTIATRILESGSCIETKMAYDTEGRIISETELTDGVESTRTEISYDADGNILEKVLFIGGEKYSRQTFERSGNVETETTIAEDEEESRVVTTHDGANWKKEFYDGEILVESQIAEFNNAHTTESIACLDAAGEHFLTITNTYDQDGQVLTTERTTPEGHVLFRQYTTYQAGKIINEEISDYESAKFFQIIHEHDDRGLLLRTEFRGPDNQLLQFRIYAYDEKEFLVQDSGYSTGEFDVIYGTSVNHEHFEFRHEYHYSETGDQYT